MIFKSAIAVVLLAITATPGFTNASELEARPAKCIALRKGQVCYQTITLRWQTELPGNYCLLSDDNLEPLMCWNNLDRGSIRYDFASKKSQQFHLIATDGDNPLVSANVVVAWVYKNRSAGRPRWRLF